MNDALFSWAEIINVLPIVVAVVPYVIWALAFRSAYVSQSGSRGVWLMFLAISLFIFPLFGAAVYFLFRNSPTLAKLPQGRTISEVLYNAKQMQDRTPASRTESDIPPDVSVSDVADIQTPTAHTDPNDFSTHVPPLPDKPSDKYEVLK